MPPDIATEIDDLHNLTTGELAERYEELHGQPCRTRRRAYLIRRIAWPIQANAEGYLSERARKRARELASDAEVRVMAPAHSSARSSRLPQDVRCPPARPDSGPRLTGNTRAGPSRASCSSSQFRNATLPRAGSSVVEREEASSILPSTKLPRMTQFGWPSSTPPGMV